jgi:ABC-type transporter MlaC component
MRIRKLVPTLALAFACLGLATTASADSAGAQSFVEKEHGRLRKLIDGDAPVPEINSALSAMIDWEEFAKLTLGNPCPKDVVVKCVNHWDELTPAQRTEVQGLLQKLVEKRWRKRLKETKNFKVSYQWSKEQSDASLAKVRTEAKDENKPKERPVTIDYLVRDKTGSYKVVDILLEHSSQAKGYYTQFHDFLTAKDKGYPYLVKKLNDRIAEREKEETSKK